MSRSVDILTIWISYQRFPHLVTYKSLENVFIKTPKTEWSQELYSKLSEGLLDNILFKEETKLYLFFWVLFLQI